MVKRRMKQRVAVALATVWLASIVGASVPSGETTAFSTPRPPGPSPDQYTPLFRNPRYYSQDDFGQDWMNDEPLRIKVANRQEESDQGETAITDSDRPLTLESARNEFFNRKPVETGEDSPTPYRFRSKDKRTRSESEREAIRLSSMKVAFDEPIDSELSDNTSDEDWANDDLEKDEVMRDEFVPDDTFEDEGPGSVEVYKLDLYKDNSILSPKPLRKNYLRNKSKIPKKVGAVDRIDRKSKDPAEDSKQHLPKTVSTFDQHSEEFSPSSRASKDRIFGVGGVPELQVGCEGVEGTQRQKRSDPDEPAGRDSNQSDDIRGSPSSRATPLYIDAEYDSEEEFGGIGGTDELFKILSKATAATEAPSNNGNRGDMDPRVKTPADLDKPRRKDKLPIRGDLGPSGDQNLADTDLRGERNVSSGNHSRGNPRRQLFSAEENLAENVRDKRSSVWGYGETEGATNERGKRGQHRGRRGHRDGKRRRRHDGEHGREREENKTRRRSEAVDKNGKDNKKNPEDHIGENRFGSTDGSRQSFNSLRQLPRREAVRSEDYAGRQGKQMKAEKLSEKEDVTRDENDRKLAEYMRRITPIQRRQSPEDNQWRARERENELGGPNSKNEAPQNIRLPVSPVRNNERIDTYAENRRHLQEQRQRGVERISRAEYERKLQRHREEQRRPSAERAQSQRQGKRVYHQRSQQEIERLKALPVSAYIFVGEKKQTNIESRFDTDRVTFPGLNPDSEGRNVSNFLSPHTTQSPPAVGVSPCVWAIIKCCTNKNRLATCFEAMGCQHGYWDNPCTLENRVAVLQMINKNYKG